MKESIRIRNFGPVADVYIEDIKPLTVFIGESGSGKSTILKLIAMFRWIYKKMCIQTFLHKSGVGQTFPFSLETYLQNQEQEHYLRDDSYIEYRNGDTCLLIENKELRGTDAPVPLEALCLEKIAFIADKRVVVSDLQVGNIVSRKNSFYLNETFDDYSRATEKVKTLDIPYLGIRFDIKKTSDGVQHRIKSLADSKSVFDIELTEASSGMQTTVPMVAIIEYFSRYYDLVDANNRSLLTYFSQSDNLKGFQFIANISDFKQRRITLCVEEPELGLFPAAQDGLMRFISNRCFNTPHDYDMNVLVTTHSPYILNYLNVLVNERPDSGFAIAPDKAGVFLVKDGLIEPLLGIGGKGNPVIDTRALSDDIRTSFERYKELTDNE